MNKKILKFLAVGLAISAFTACEPDDPELSTITEIPMTIESIDSGGEVAEESAGTITVNFALDADQIVDAVVGIEVDPLNTTATEGVDFVLSTHVVELNAYQRSASFDITILSDYLAEGDETVSLIVSGLQDPFGPSNSQTYNLTIKDYIDPELLVLTFDWEGLGFYQGIGYSLCENVDLDILFVDETGADIGTSYEAATGDCPETIMMNADTPDGTYILASNMWANGFAGLMSNNDFPIRISIDKPGIYNEMYTPEQVWNSEEDTGDNGNGETKPALTVIKEGNTFTVNRPDGTQIVQGLTPITTSDGHKAAKSGTPSIVLGQ